MLPEEGCECSASDDLGRRSTEGGRSQGAGGPGIPREPPRDSPHGRCRGLFEGGGRRGWKGEGRLRGRGDKRGGNGGQGEGARRRSRRRADDEGGALEPEPKQKNHFPASLGLSVLLPPAIPGASETVRATVTFADYLRHEEPNPDKPAEQEGHLAPRPAAPAHRHAPARCRVHRPRGASLPDTLGVEVCGKLETIDAPGLAPGTRALSLFVVNRRAAGEKGPPRRELPLSGRARARLRARVRPAPQPPGRAAARLRRPHGGPAVSRHCEWAVGHNVAVASPDRQRAPRHRLLRTTWIPTERSASRGHPRRARGRHRHGGPRRARRGPWRPCAPRSLPSSRPTGSGSTRRQSISLDSDKRDETRDKLLSRTPRAKDRIAEGIALLATDPDAREAFR